MTPEDYRTALTTLGLTQQAAGRWLRVSPKTAQNYAKHGPSGPAAVAVEMRLALTPVLAEMLEDRDIIEIDDWIDALSAALKGEAG